MSNLLPSPSGKMSKHHKRSKFAVCSHSRLLLSNFSESNPMAEESDFAHGALGDAFVQHSDWDACRELQQRCLRQTCAVVVLVYTSTVYKVLDDDDGCILCYLAELISLVEAICKCNLESEKCIWTLNDLQGTSWLSVGRCWCCNLCLLLI